MKQAVMGRISVLVVFFLLLAQGVSAQCSMCRAPLEGNVSDGTFLLTSENLNAGITLLFVTPYLLIGAVALFWYLNARKHARNLNGRGYSQG
ncbi:hypothetical protein [Cesiribacter andamanensis]|uniref:Uncharacterized protein n=1 Tax=Cesiribacter andamanensis AMV16 TaxID=1279009 RepID=M7NMM5_9BACT|nr:hypothetical protein [Cesiribacter andamanensis]EMR03025.1 hypothetical protein ADICEAN_01819 [Cesiribacter andamanensis AMV16]